MNISDFLFRDVVRLLGQTVALGESHTEKKRFLMNGLCKVIGADSWIWALGPQMEAQKPQVFVSFLHGGFSDGRFSNYLKAVAHPEMTPIASRFAERVQETGQHTTMRRHEIDFEDHRESNAIGALLKKADIGPLMLSAHPLDKSSASIVGLYRKFGEKPFTDLEKSVAHTILSEVPSLHLSDWPEDRGIKARKLYPQQRVVLNLLLDGMSRKKIASHMSLSENTVSGYVKSIYRHFEVSSHVELMHHFYHAAV